MQERGNVAGVGVKLQLSMIGLQTPELPSVEDRAAIEVSAVVDLAIFNCWVANTVFSEVVDRRRRCRHSLRSCSCERLRDSPFDPSLNHAPPHTLMSPMLFRCRLHGRL